MAPSEPNSKTSLSSETSPMCRRRLSTDGELKPVTSDESVAHLLQQIFACTKVQKKLLADFPSYLCLTCTSRLDLLDMYRSLCALNNVKIKEEVDTTHLTGSETTAEHSDADMQQTGGVGSVVKTEVVAEDSEEDYQSSQTVSNIQQIIYDYNHHDDLFEAEEESLETLLKREPMDDQQQPSKADWIHEEASPAGKTITDSDDPASTSGQNNSWIKWNQMDPNGEEKSEHTGNQPVSVIGERRLLRSSKRRSSQKDIAAAELSVSTMHRIHNKDQHQCPHCPRQFAWQGLLKDHIRTHTGEKPFLCKLCGKAFHSERCLHAHMRIHNKAQNQCPHCSGKFARQSKLKEHIRTHTGEKPFVCKVCSKAFHVASNLHRHMQTHDKDQHRCPHCPSKFAQQFRLNDHIRTHTGEKPFQCKVCSKTFHAATVLRRHMHIHYKDQHRCPHCPGKFARPEQLQDHIRTHTGEKPFLCQFCGKAFHSVGILCKHMKTHNKDQHQSLPSQIRTGTAA